MYGLCLRRIHVKWYEALWYWCGESGLGPCTSCWGRLMTVAIIKLSILRLMRFYHVWLIGPCCGINNWDTLAKRDFMLCIVKVWLKVFLIIHLNFISMNTVFMENKTK